MASTYSTSLRIQLIGTGDQSGVWGTSTNTNLGTLIEQAITGVQSITLSGSTYTLTSFNGILDQARNAALSFTGALSANCTVIAPAANKVYIVQNATSGGQTVTMSVGSGSTVVVPNGQTYIVYTDGSNFYSASNYTSSNVAITGGTIDGTVIGGTTPSNGFFYDLTAYNTANFGVSNAPRTVSFTSASPTIVTMAVGTRPITNAQVTFTSTINLPSGITAGVIYYVVPINSTQFNLSSTSGGAADVNTSSTGSGTISMVTNSSVTFNTSTANIPNNLIFSGTGAITLPTGSTAQQPGSSNSGMIRFNSTTNSFEGYANGSWSALGATNTTNLGLWQNIQLISVTQTISSGYSAMSSGPITLSPPIAPQTVTITIASPGVFTVPTTALPAGTSLILTTTGSLPTGLTSGVTYYVINPSGLTFQLSTSSTGSPITTTGSQSGVHTATPTVFVTVPSGSRWVIL
tara:strand:- start:3821 stop:5206 length:1386 start_codon:yes stop_codon:yes gene_type:complete